MLTHASLLRFLRPGDWFTSIDLKDAYFHIPIYPPHRKYLRFAFQGTSYEYLVLPFGLSLSPRVFVKCTEAAVGPLRGRGLRVATYIDDWLIAASSHQEAADHTRQLTAHLLNLGFNLNLEKSVFLPCQKITFIGLLIDSAQARVRLTGERLQVLRDCLSLFQRGKFVSLRLCQRLLGLMASALVTDCLEQQTLPVRESYSCAGDSELWSRSPVQGKPPLCRMEASPRCGEPDLGALRATISGSLCNVREHSLSPVFLASRPECTSGGGRTGSPVASHSPVCIPPDTSDFSYPSQSEGGGLYDDSHSALLASKALAGGDNSAPVSGALAPANPEGPVVSGARRNISSSPGQAGSVDLACEWFNLRTVGLPLNVIETIQSARAPSTRTLYGRKWSVFEKWCSDSHQVPFQCSVTGILSFLQDMVDKGRAFSTIKVYLAAISACHIGFEGKTVGQHPLICRFMRGARRKLPVCRSLAPSWDLPLVLNALSDSPFEPLEQVDLKFVALKTALLLCLASAKRVGEIQALSVHKACTKFSSGNARVTLQPNPAFMPKVLGSCSPIDLLSFNPPPFSSDEQKRLHMLCPVRALRVYIDRTKSCRKSDQLFVSWAKSRLGRPVSKQRLSHWIVWAIALAYNAKGLQPPEGLRAHSTRGLTTSWALFRGVSVEEICAAASWASSHTFARFYRLDVTAPTLAHSVLNLAQPQ
ncbi:uncharacterized protein LOC115408980 [Salarias fasciatus]|uniref:uncharacterized protein LOC115408980 n=1 Tax=Salarias fasciatus TaxID=181472 RepID=UPI00117678C7|nr:uncharacterized protein LOC115408980 [Salarias fasciatus]